MMRAGRHSVPDPFVPRRHVRLWLKGGGERPPHRRSHFEPRLFLPGEPVRETGIYEVLHDREHRAAHDAVMHAGDPFPTCETCHDRVRFRLVRTAPYIFDDEDFEPET
jgi:hypothetical protein